MLAFPAIGSAAACAVAIQHAIGTGWTGVPVAVRIGMHAGNAKVEGGDFFGRTVVITGSRRRRRRWRRDPVNTDRATSPRRRVPPRPRPLTLLERDGRPPHGLSTALEREPARSSESNPTTWLTNSRAMVNGWWKRQRGIH
jgi:hypothetical protein